jgi:WD40 repeat protein
MSGTQRQADIDASLNMTMAGADPRLLALVKEYQAALDAGTRPDREAILARCPELAGDLGEYLDAIDMVQAAAPRLQLDTNRDGGPDSMLPEGSMVGEFRVVRELGRGGMGVVYEAVQEPLGRRVALKVLPPQYAKTSHLRERFQREAQAAARLHHTNIVPVFAVGTHEGVAYYAMQLIEGRPLDQFRPAAGAAGRSSDMALSPQQVAAVGMQVADALEYVHQHGIIHRDVKPGNLLLDAAGVVWVTDFGLAQVAGNDKLTEAGDLVGTLRYLAPERFAGVADARSDVYSLGVTLYELCTGRPVFAGDDRARLVRCIQEEVPAPPRSLVPDFPLDLETILMKAVEKEPSRRYPSASAMADDLRRFLEDRPILARPLGTLGRVARWCRRKPMLAALTGLVLLATLITMGTLAGAYAVVSDALTVEKQAKSEAEQKREEARLKAEENFNLARLERTLRTRIQQSEARFFFEEAYRKGMEEDVTGIPALARALEKAADADLPDLERTVRLHLGERMRHAHRLTSYFTIPAPVEVAAISPDATRLVVGDGGADLRVLDAATGKQLGPPLAHPGPATFAVFHRDGKRLAAGTEAGTVHVWSLDARTSTVIEHGDAVTTMAWDSKGETLFIGGRKRGVTRRNVATGKPVGRAIRFHVHVETLGLTADDRNMIVVDPLGMVVTFDTETAVMKGQTFSSVTGIKCLTFTSDGSHVAFGADDGVVHLGTLAQGHLLNSSPLVTHSPGVRAVSFHPSDGRILVCGQNGLARVSHLKAIRRTQERYFTGLPMSTTSPVVAGAFHPHDGRILTIGHNGEVRWWANVPTLEVGPPLQHQGQIVSIAYGCDGKQLLTADMANSIHVWDAREGKVEGKPFTFGPPKPARLSKIYAAFSPERKRVLAGASALPAEVRDVSTGELIGPSSELRVISAGAFHPDGKRFALGGPGVVWLCDIKANRPIAPVLACRGSITTIGFSPDGKLLAAGGTFRRVCLWDVETQTPIGEGLPHTGQISCIAFSPDGKTLAIGGYDDTVRLWDVDKTGPRGRAWKLPAGIGDLAFSPDGGKLLLTSVDTFSEWEAATGKQLGPAIYHDNVVTAACYRPDGKVLAAGGHDKTVRQWQATQSIQGEANRVVLWTQVATGTELDDQNQLRTLDATTWNERRRRLESLGGPPTAD